MKQILVSAVVFGMVACAGCSTPTRVGSGAIKAATFDFVQNLPGRKTDFSENTEAVHQIIQKAITDHLAQKGVARSVGGGDVKVAYLIIVGDNVSTMAINDYFGYNRDDWELADKAHKAYTVNNKNPDYFEAGTLLIDVLDAKTHKLLMRNHVTKPILRNPPPDAREARIREAVDEALKNLRIKP
jgi:hypothetical protein